MINRDIIHVLSNDLFGNKSESIGIISYIHSMISEIHYQVLSNLLFGESTINSIFTIS